MSHSRHHSLWLAALFLASLPGAVCQTMTLNPNWLPAGSGSDPVRISFSSLDETTNQLLLAREIGVRWNGQLLPAHLFTPAPPAVAAAILEFTVPTALRVPGLAEFVLWNMQTQQPMPLRGWMPVIIPTAATVFEA